MPVPDDPRPAPPQPAPITDARILRLVAAALQAQRRRFGAQFRIMQQVVAAAGDDARAPEVVDDVRAILRDLREMAGPYA